MIKKLLPLAIVAAFAAGSAQAATFVNGDFEAGNLTGWTGGGGSWQEQNYSYSFPHISNGAPRNPSEYVGGTPNNTIVGVGLDPITGASTTYGGQYAVRVNDSTNNYSVSTLTQTVNNYTDNSIFFAWNAVLEASHDLDDSDYFSLTLRDLTSNMDLVSRSYSSAGSIGSGTSGVTWTGGTWKTSGWVVEQIDLTTAGAGNTSIVGHDFELTLLASDCPYGGHAGYVYLDGFGGTIPTQGDVPEPASLALMGLGVAALAATRRKKKSA